MGLKETIERKSCAIWNSKVNDLLVELEPDVVIFASSIGASYMLGRSDRNVDKVAARMAQSWKRFDGPRPTKLIAIRETPRMKEDPPTCLMREKATPHACDTARWMAISKESIIITAAAESRSVHVIDMNDAICEAETCPTSMGGVYVWRDKHHLTASFAKSLSDELATKISPIIEDAAR